MERKLFVTDDYLNSKDALLKHISKKGLEEGVSEFSTFSGVPLICCYELIADDFQESKEFIQKKIAQLWEFYQV